MCSLQELTHPDVEEDKDDGKENRTNEEQTVLCDEGGGVIKCEDAEMTGARECLWDQEDENSDWPRERVCHTHERAIPVQQTVEALDITEEGKRKRTQGIYINEVTEKELLVIEYA